MKQELAILEARQLNLEREVAALHAPAPLIHPNLDEIYRQQVDRLNEPLKDLMTRDESFELIRSLIGEVDLVPEDGRLRVDLRGEPAGILALAANGEKPGGLAAAWLTE